MTSLADIITKFKAAFEAFNTTNERPTDLYVTQIYGAIVKIFLLHLIRQRWVQAQPYGADRRQRHIRYQLRRVVPLASVTRYLCIRH